jgi:hypothetical protein
VESNIIERQAETEDVCHTEESHDTSGQTSFVDSENVRQDLLATLNRLELKETGLA